MLSNKIWWCNTIKHTQPLFDVQTLRKALSLFPVRKQLNLSQIRFLIHSCYKSKKKRIKFQLTFLTSNIKQESLERWREFCNLKFKCVALSKLTRLLLRVLQVSSTLRAHLQRQVAQLRDYSCVSWSRLNRNEEKKKKWTCKHTNVG